MTDPDDSSLRDADRLVYAGLLWLAVTCVLKLMEKGVEDLAQEIELYAFATAIPILAVGLVTDYARRAGRKIPWWHDLFCISGGFASIVGFGSLLFHFNLIIGIVFSVGCVVSLLIVRRL